MKKIQGLFIIAVMFAASHLPGQTADSLVAAGLALLATSDDAAAYANLPAAYSDFNRAVLLSPNHEAANALAAVTRLLLLPQHSGASNALNRLGVSRQGRDLFNWTAHFTTNSNGQVVLPTTLNSTEAIALLNTNVMPAVRASLTNLDRITSRAFTLYLTADETHVREVTLDWGDIELMRAALHAAEFAVHTLNAHNLSVMITHLQDLGNATPSQLTVQKVLADYPSLFGLTNKSELAASKATLTNAIAHYLAASDFIRDTNNRPPDVGLFDLPPDGAADEAAFRDALTKALASLDHPVPIVSNSTALLYTGPYFAGSHSLRSLFPNFNGNLYVSNSLPDYTFGGVLLDEPAYVTEALLREKLAPTPYAGIYVGQLGEGSPFDFSPDGGGFAVFVNTRQQATMIAYDVNLPTSGYTAQFPVSKSGNWQFSTNGVFVGGQLNWLSEGTVFGEIFDMSNGDWWEDMLGNVIPEAGAFQNADGYYAGTWSGAGGTGKLSAILSADGQFYFCQFASNGQPADGGNGQLDVSGHLTALSVGETAIGGALNSATFKINGTFANRFGSGTFTLTRSNYNPQDIPPTIKTPPYDLVGISGSNVTFKVVAAGSPPLCYQWSLNGENIQGATSSSLMLTNLHVTSDPTNFTVVVQNLAGSNSASAQLVQVVGETVPPTVAITSPASPGLFWSNAVFYVTGTAKDNVGVSNVWCQLNNGDWETASGTTNWTNRVTLAPGTNLFRVFAEDTCGNHSLIATSSVRYVVSDRLGVQATGPCTMSPNYSNAWLVINQSYSITATPGTGFAFANWTGGTSLPLAVLTNGRTVRFSMTSNLMLQANFVDTNKPTLTITSPTAGQKMTNALANVNGTARDNWGVGSVQYQLNGGAWGLATSTNGWTNWTAVLPLTAGTNVIKAYAVDLGGNTSATSTVSVVSSNTFNLRLGFSSAHPMASNGLQLSLEVSHGISGRLEVSTNLEEWTTLTSFGRTNTTIQFLDSAATNLSRRFYRAVVP